MSRRLHLTAIVVLLAVAVVLASADLWLPAGLCVGVCTYLSGRFDYKGRLAEVTAELGAALARERRLDAELNDWHGRRAVNGVGHLPPSTSSARDSNPAAQHATRPTAQAAARLP